ncbi:non-ribosomal peptide synthetase [Saccharothrix sp. Mg75]|uniref:non-ribosomal peptide synthetase n=1 Tax=Saccharothrix sp. Mg75 TaxID=3445357 RepID=UPI003EEA61C3
MVDLVANWVRRRPDSQAVREPLGGAVLTYRELWEKSAWLSAHLAGAGVRKGDLVAVSLPRSADLVVALLGILRAGAAYLPLDTFAPSDRIRGILQDSGVKNVVCAESDDRAGSWPVRSLGIPDRLPAGQVPTGSAAGDDTIYVTYTSGSTGRPKGVVIPHRGVVRLVVSPNFCTIEPGDRIASTCNPAFDGTTWEIWGALASGATVVPFPQLTSMTMDDWLRLLGDEAITSMLLTTSLFHSVARERPDAFHTVKNLLVGGEQLDVATVRRVLETRPPARLVNCYGPTEGSAIASFFECTAESLAGVGRVPIGYALQETDLLVLDEHLREVPQGGVGELCLGGPGVASGYLGAPDLTADRFVIEPTRGARVYRTGDLVKRLSTGALEMVGRRDRQVKLRGFRIELEEVERVIVESGVVDAAFVEKVGDGPAATLVGFVLPRTADTTADAQEVLSTLPALLARDLPAYMVPARWVLLPELPLGATGKADRGAMLQLLDLDSADSGTRRPEEPSDPVHAGILTILRDLLETAEVPSGANFVQLGGNSILAVRVAHRIRATWDLPVEPADVLAAETVGDLIGRLKDGDSLSSTPRSLPKF